MTNSWLIIADDLTGAADCAIAFAQNGIGASVVWGTGTASTPAIAFNVESRPLAASKAAALHSATLDRLHHPRTALYKKIDSTMRGQPAAELAATIAFLKHRGQGDFAVVAPAFPGTGRTTENGAIKVQGYALEETMLWAREHTYDSANLTAILASVQIKAELITLAQIRQGPQAIRDAITEIKRGSFDAMVCDAITQADLDHIAEATLSMLDDVFWVGSGGLAASLARLSSQQTGPQPLTIAKHPGGILIAVASLGEASRLATRHLASSGKVRHVPIHPDAILCEDNAALGERLAPVFQNLASGQDVLVEVVQTDNPDLKRGGELVERLAASLAPAAVLASGLIATGGDTAIALLNHFSVDGIRLADEVESGIPLGLTIGMVGIPIITKAGAFGDETTLSRCLDRIHLIKQKGSF